jgi:hypothetical protein
MGKRIRSQAEIDYDEYERITIAKVIVDVNKMRKDMGMQLVTQVEKNCLRCDKKFLALKNSANFLCNRCRSLRDDQSFDI